MKVELLTHHGHGCVRLTAPTLESDTPPRTVVGVMDTSGSMGGQKLQDAKTTLQWVVRNLRPNVDSFALVHFSNEAAVSIPVQVVTDMNREGMLIQIGRLLTTGSTNLEAGLRLALEMLPMEGGSMVLATDGVPNVGLTQAEPLLELIRGKPVRLDTAGLGMHHNEDLLTSLAAEMGGVYTFLETSAAIQDWAATRLGTCLTVSARTVDVALAGVSGVRTQSGTDTYRQVKYDTMSSGEVKHILTVLDGEEFSAKVSYLDNDNAFIEVDSDPSVEDVTAVELQLCRWRFIDTVGQAKELADTGSLPQARLALNNLIQAFESMPIHETPEIAEYLQRLRGLLPTYQTEACFRSLGRRISTESARGCVAEEDVGGGRGAGLFTNQGQVLMRQLSAPPALPSAGGAGGAGGAAAPPGAPAMPSMARQISVGAAPRQRPPSSKWQWQGDVQGMFEDFTANVQRQLEQAFRSGQKEVSYSAAGTSYTAYLEPMVQRNNATKYVRHIRRVAS